MVQLFDQFDGLMDVLQVFLDFFEYFAVAGELEVQFLGLFCHREIKGLEFSGFGKHFELAGVSERLLLAQQLVQFDRLSSAVEVVHNICHLI